ncbi:MAG: phage portal protein [Candidatus Thorarchaeota archaeon]
MNRLLSWLVKKMNINTSMSTDYEGASQTRRLRTWGLSSSGINTALSGSRTNLVNRTRDLHRNNPEISGGIDTKTANIIGRGITPRWNIDDISDTIKELWDQSALEIDANEQLDFYGLQALATDTISISGEILVQYIYRTLKSGLTVPFQIKLLECDHLNDLSSYILPNGNTLKLGIEFNRSNRRVAYHLYKNHPGETYIFSDTTTIRIPANKILHIYRIRRPGQIRGYPTLSPIIARMHQFDEYEDAELTRKKMAAMVAYFVETPDGDPDVGLGGETIEATNSDGETEDVQYIEPGLMTYLNAGEKMNVSLPADVGGNYEAFIDRNLCSIAKGMGITREQLTGDLSKVNYSSIRAGYIEVRRLFRMFQNHIIIQQMCRPIAQEWLDIAYVSSIIKIQNYLDRRKSFISKMKWDIDGWEWVDPLKSEKAEILAIRSGRKSLDESLGERGKNSRDVMKEIAKDNSLADELGLQLDSDGRKVNQTGTQHSKSTGGF